MSKLTLKIIKPHEVLGIKEDATENEIKKAYKKLALKNHPDKVAEEEKDAATKRFQKISEAYNELLNIKIKISSLFAEVSGKVVLVNSKNTNIFHIYCPNIDKEFKCVYEGFLPLRKGDAILGICKIIEESLVFETPPFVVQGKDTNTILEFFSNSLRGKNFSSKKGKELLEILISRSGNFLNAVKMLDRLSVYLNYSGEEDISDLNIGDEDPSIPFSRIINKIQFAKLMTDWYKRRVLRNLYLLGLTNKEIIASKINPLVLYDKILENPYVISCINLIKCENILKQCGKNVDDSFRECGKIVRKISELMEKKGWSAVPTSTILKIFPNIKEYLPKLKDEFGIETDLFSIYLPYAYEVETKMADWVKNLLKSDLIISVPDISYTRDDLSDDQKNSIKMALNNNISIITGPGGSGKTICIKELVHNLEKNGINYRIASFTGRAVARVREVVGKKEPATLHMMISMNKVRKDGFKCLILDEASMITTELLYEFRKKFTHDYSIILVGDCNQLEPISWGSLFESLISSRKVPITTLKIMHRTENTRDNGIIINSKKIIEHKEPDYNGPPFEFTITSNFKIIPGDLQTVQNLVNILNNNGIDPFKISIISPYNRDLEVLNNNSSILYNSLARSTTDFRAKKWRIGDRVMATTNNYKNNVLNGDEGYIIDVEDIAVTVKFKNGTYKYLTTSFSEDDDGSRELNTEQLILSYACSVHRLQGSEAEYIIGYIPEGKEGTTFLNSNLLYTLITRAKKMIWLVGDCETMERAAITKTPYRCENLAKRINS